jgi:hypothetical protein
VREKNVYTIEKNGVKKLIYQSPWYYNGEYAGFVELSLEIPFEMEHCSFVIQSQDLRSIRTVNKAFAILKSGFLDRPLGSMKERL